VTIDGLRFENAGVGGDLDAGIGNSLTVEHNTMHGLGLYLKVSAPSTVRLIANRIEVQRVDGGQCDAIAVGTGLSGGQAVVDVERNRITADDPATTATAIDVGGGNAGRLDTMIASSVVHAFGGCNCGGAGAIDILARGGGRGRALVEPIPAGPGGADARMSPGPQVFDRSR